MSAAQRLAEGLNELAAEVGAFEPCSCCDAEIWGLDDNGESFGVRPGKHGWEAVE